MTKQRNAEVILRTIRKWGFSENTINYIIENELDKAPRTWTSGSDWVAPDDFPVAYPAFGREHIAPFGIRISDGYAFQSSEEAEECINEWRRKQGGR